jgi:hypothetical protein
MSHPIIVHLNEIRCTRLDGLRFALVQMNQHWRCRPGPPCFQGMTTIQTLRDKFVLDKSERDAADYMLGLIEASRKTRGQPCTIGFKMLQRNRLFVIARLVGSSGQATVEVVLNYC